MTVCRRQGGESIALGDPVRHRSLKKLWQEREVPPWQRDELPLLFHGDELIAVWGFETAVNHRRQS